MPWVEGIVRISNDYLVSEYIGNPPAGASAFRDGWFYPGDRGVINAQGNFSTTGRTNDVFNIGGSKINPMILDHVLMGVDGVEEAASFS